jgi:hypothetical protein
VRLLPLLLLAVSIPALAGPPFVTDDPEPVEYQHFEINTAMQGTYTKDGRAGAWPTIDANYGLAPGVQFHVGLFANSSRADGEAFHYGYGDTEVGVKVRFIDEDEEGWRPQVAVYPITQFPTGSAEKGLGAGHQRTILPIWVQKSFGDWTTYGGGGYWLNKSDIDRDYWFAGWVVMRKIDEKWTLGGELFYNTASQVETRSSTGFNLGGYYNLDEGNNIIFTVGRGVQNADATNRFSYYVGYQLAF